MPDPASTRCKVAVIGFGNTIRGDDALGVAAVDLVRRHFELTEDSRLLRAGVTFATSPSLQVGREDELSTCSNIILVDAWEGGEGVVVREVAAEDPVRPLTSHASSPETLLSLLQTLYGRSPKIHLVAIAGKDFGLRDGLSREAEASLSNAVDIIVDLIDSILPPV
ncbi:MAG: hydrogenase maturation protease [Chloroflexi bacterium]|nr:hydrogenase maturation protease [Chloroflexota bacterium]